VGYLALIPIGWSPFPWQVQWADVVFVGLLIGVLAQRHGASMTRSRLDLLVALYLVASLVSFSATSDARQSGIELMKQLYLGLVYWVFRSIGREPAEARRVVSWYAGVAAGLSALALLAWIGSSLWSLPSPLLYERVQMPVLGSVVRIQGTVMTPALFCNYLTVALPLLVFMAARATGRRSKRRWRFATLVVVLAAIGTMTYSIMGCLGAALFTVWHRWGASRARRSLRAILAVCWAAVLIGTTLMLSVAIRQVQVVADHDPQVLAPPYYYAFQDEQRGASRLTMSVSYNPMGYHLLKAIAMNAFRRSPLTGTGLGTFHQETERAYHDGLIHETYRRTDPHAELFGRLAETGLLGGVTLVWLWWGWIRLGSLSVRSTPSSISINRALLAGLLGLLVNSVNTDIMNFAGYGYNEGAYNIKRGNNDHKCQNNKKPPLF
jgi:hypothetical protein